jgi:hypothetical protein
LYFTFGDILISLEESTDQTVSHKVPSFFFADGALYLYSFVPFSMFLRPPSGRALWYQYHYQGWQEGEAQDNPAKPSDAKTSTAFDSKYQQRYSLHWQSGSTYQAEQLLDWDTFR